LLDHVVERAASLKAKGKDAPAWYSSSARYCTSDHKRAQIWRLFTRLANETRAARGKSHQARILDCVGMRGEESPARAKKPAFKFHKAASNGRRHVDQWLPIHAWTVGEVWEEIARSGLRHHEAYDLGMGRLSCAFCIFATKNDLLIAGKHNPELLAQYVAVEDEVGTTFKTDLSLAEIQAELAAGAEPQIDPQPKRYKRLPVAA
jgi:3'-phosphoadenosine 5'-phosphosulfate sulfotransferase (PAPS reductase)/FAD synthetase